MKNIEASVTSLSWWRAAGIRALRTFAQALLASIPAAVVASEAGWGWVNAIPAAAGTAVLAAFLSLLTSLSGLPEVDK